MFEPLPQLVRARRESLGLSQGEVAKRAGVGRAQYALLEGGRANVTLGFLIKIARVLGITTLQVDELSFLGSAPDLKALVRAQEAVDRARVLFGQFSAATAELDDVSDSIRRLIANPMAAAAGDPEVAGTVRELAGVPAAERGSVGRAMRDVAQSSRVERQQRPEAPAGSAARKRARR